MQRIKWQQIKKMYPKGTIVSGLIEVVLDSGCFIRINRSNQITGFISRSEINYAKKGAFFQADFEVREGATLTALVEVYNKDHHYFELSLRKFFEKEAEQRFLQRKKGDEITGLVSSYVEGGAFILIDGGGEAFLPISELPLNKESINARIDELLSIGDRIKAIIIDCNEDNRRFILSVRHYFTESNLVISELRSDSPVLENFIEENMYDLHTVGSEEFSGKQRRVLLLEDDQVFSEYIRKTLLKYGHSVDPVMTLKDAHSMGIKNSYDFIIADVSMGDGQHSTEYILSLCSIENTPKAIFMTGEYSPNDIQLIHTDSSKVREATVKPIDPVRILELLKTCDSPGRFECDNYCWEMDDVKSNLPAAGRLNDEASTINKHFDVIARRYPDDGVCILQRIVGSHVFKVVRSERLNKSNMDILFIDAPFDLQYSPIGDVLIKGQSLYKSGLSRDKPWRFGHFLEDGACDLAGITAVPILINDETEFGIFIFLDNNREITKEDRIFLEEQSSYLSIALQAARNLDMIMHHHSRSMVSQMLAHELFGLIGNMREIIDLEQVIREGRNGETSEIICRLKKTYELMHETTTFFRNVSSISFRSEMESVAESIDEVVQVLKLRAERWNIELTYRYHDGFESIRKPKNSLRQILVNVILNALIHVREANKTGKRFVVLDGHFTGDNHTELTIEISDNANGIHSNIWNLIFRPYFTTRKEGSGLGLFFCKQTAEAMQGRIELTESWMFYGSKFSIILPCK